VTLGPLKIGIIGAGIAGQRHAEAFARNPRAVVAAVTEIDEGAGQRFARAFGAQQYQDYRAMLASGLDAVVICVPHVLHLPCALAAAEARTHILMEKPIANTLEEAHAILDAAGHAGVTLMMGYVHRFRPEVSHAKELVASGALGRVATALDRFVSGSRADTPAWVWSKAQAGGGVLMYGGVHPIDRLRWLLAENVVEVYARIATYANRAEVEDGAVALLTFESGATGVLYENAPGYGRLGGWVTELFGTTGALMITTGTALEYRGTDRHERWTYHDDQRFDRQAAEFIAAIAEHRPPTVTGEDGVRGLEVVLAIYRSAASGRPERVRP
jgi:UDP-N-acetylglucosamine 3-dehydrogenase